MITVHARSGKLCVVLNEPETLSAPQLREGIAEALVATGEADSDEVGDLRLAVEQEDHSWQDITTSKDNLKKIGISDGSVVGFVIGDGDFGYEAIRDEDEE